MTNIRKYVENTSWVFCGRVIQLTTSFLVGLYVVRYLGPERYGLIAYTLSLSAFGAVIVPLGMDGILVKQLVRAPDMENRLIGTGILLRFVSGLVAFLLIMAYVLQSKCDAQTALAAAIVNGSLILQCFFMLDVFFQAKVASKFSTISQLITVILSSMLRLILVQMEAPMLAFAVIILCESVFLSIGFLLLYMKGYGSPLAWRFSKQVAWESLQQSWPFLISGIATTIYLRFDQIIIHGVMGNENLGVYSAAIRITEIWYFIPMAIAASVLPALIATEQRDQRLFTQRTQLMYDAFFWGSVVVAASISIFSDSIIRALYREEFSGAAAALRITAWAGVFTSITIVRNQWMLSKGLQNHLVVFSIVGAGFSFALNLLLVPLYGIRGAAWTVLLSQMVSGLFCTLLNKKTHFAFFMAMRAANPFRLLIIAKIAYASCSAYVTSTIPRLRFSRLRKM